MPFDFEQHKRELVEHYRVLFAEPAWTAYVTAHVRKLAKWRPDFYGDLPALVGLKTEE